VRARLMASFGGKRGLQDRIEALKKHIEDMNEPDALDFGQEAMDHGKTGKVKRKEDPATKKDQPVAEAEARNRWDKGQQIEDKAKGKDPGRSLASVGELEKAKVEDWKQAEEQRKGKPADKLDEKPAKAKKPKIHESDATLAHIIKNRGGIRSDDHSFKAHFGSIKEAMEYGLSLGLFNKNSKQGLDQIAKSMAEEGHLIVPDGEDPVPHLVEGLKRKARSAAEDLTKKYDKAYEEYAKELEEAHNDGITSEQIRATEAEVHSVGEAQGAEDKYGQGSSGVGDDTDFGFGANESKQPESGSGSGSVDLFGNPIPKSYSAKAGQQITMDDALREAWVNKAHEWADEHGTKVNSLTASGTFKAGGKEYQVGKAEDGYPIKEIGAAKPTGHDAKQIAESVVKSGRNISDVMKDLGVSIGTENGRKLRKEIMDHVDKLKEGATAASKPTPSPELQKAREKFLEKNKANQEPSAPPNIDVPDSAKREAERNIETIKRYNQELQRGRDTDKKFKGEGRYEYAAHEKLGGDMQKALKNLQQMHADGTDDGYDMSAFYKSLGHEEPSTLSSNAAEWDNEAKAAEKPPKKAEEPAAETPAPVATPKVEPSTPKATQPTPKAPVEGPPPSLDEVSRLYDMISQPNVSQGHVQQMMDRLKNAKKGDLKAIGDKIGMEFGASDTAGKMQEKIAKRFLNLKHGAMKSDSLNAANERAKKEEHEAKRRAKLGIPEPERDTPKFKKRRFDLEDELNGLTSDASDDLYQSLDDAETHTDLDTIAAKIKAEKAKSGSRPKPVAPVLPAPAPAPEQPRRDYVHNPNAKGDPTPDEVAGLHDNIARRDITEPQVQQVADRIQGIKSKATLKEIGQKIDMTFGASDTVKQMADKVIKRLLNMKRTHIKSTIFDRKQEKPTEAAPAKAPTPTPSKPLAPHEMSREDYIKQQQPKIEAEVKKIPQDYLQDRQRLSLQRQAGFEHQDAVKAAVEKGQPVHESAAKDYPNIKPTTKIEPQEHEKPLYEFAKMVQQLADTSPYEERFGDKKAFISDIYKRSQTSGALPKMTLDQFKQQLLDANNKSFLNLATQDDPNIVPRDKHDESQIEYLGNPFHHVLTSDAGKYNDKEHHKSRETQEKAWGLGLGEKGYYNNNQ